MGVRAFLRIEGIPGDCSEKNHYQWIEVLSFVHSINSRASAYGISTGASAEVGEHSSYVVAKRFDRASPRIYEACSSGTHIPTVTIQVYDTDEEPSPSMIVEMDDVVISSVTTQGQTDAPNAVEEVSFTYGSIKWTHVPQRRTDGAAGGSVVGDWSLTGTQVLGSHTPTEPDYAIVRIFYATDREPRSPGDTQSFFANERSHSGRLSFGTCDVTIPRDHRLGELETPCIWKLEFKSNPSRHVVLLNVLTENESEFFDSVFRRVDTSSGKQALVFIHGYNVTFEDAARRTAQLAYDLAFDGAAILYSWPSKGELGSYIIDETNVAWTTPHLEGFLAQLAEQSHANAIHLVAHSMGNRALTSALATLTPRFRRPLPCFSQLVLTAPDIDADSFRQLAAAFTVVAERTTLYSSTDDKALRLSHRFHGYPRAGDCIMCIPGIDTIDASSVDTSLIGHSYYGSNRSVLSDMFWLLRKEGPPVQRFGMRLVTTIEGMHYAFRP